MALARLMSEVEQEALEHRNVGQAPLAMRLLEAAIAQHLLDHGQSRYTQALTIQMPVDAAFSRRYMPCQDPLKSSGLSLSSSNFF